MRLLCVRHCSKHFPYINSFGPPNSPTRWPSLSSLSFPGEEIKAPKSKSFPNDERQSQDWSPGGAAPELMHLTTLLYSEKLGRGATHTEALPSSKGLAPQSHTKIQVRPMPHLGTAHPVTLVPCRCHAQAKECPQPSDTQCPFHPEATSGTSGQKLPLLPYGIPKETPPPVHSCPRPPVYQDCKNRRHVSAMLESEDGAQRRGLI